MFLVKRMGNKSEPVDRGKNSHTKIDVLGRVVIPVSIRRKLNIQPGTPLVIKQLGKRILVEFEEARCSICGSTYPEFKLKSERYICTKCKDEIQNIK